MEEDELVWASLLRGWEEGLDEEDGVVELDLGSFFILSLLL